MIVGRVSCDTRGLLMQTILLKVCLRVVFGSLEQVDLLVGVRLHGMLRWHGCVVLLLDEATGMRTLVLILREL